MATERLITLTNTEVLSAMTDWLNTHRFKEMVQVTKIHLGQSVRIVNGTQIDDTNTVRFVYVQEELAGQ